MNDEQQFLLMGVTSLAAAIAGGGFKFVGIEIPLLNSIKRQLLLGLLGVALICPIIYSKIIEAKGATRCEDYAKSAIEQFETGVKQSCKMEGERWHNNFAGHQGWCLTQGKASIESEFNERDKELSKCGKKTKR